MPSMIGFLTPPTLLVMDPLSKWSALTARFAGIISDVVSSVQRFVGGNELEREVRPAEEPWVSVEDVVQDTFLLAFRDIQTCRARDHETFLNWLGAIGSHQLQNVLKAARAKKRGGEKAQTRQVRSGRSSSVSDLLERLSGDGKSPSSVAARREAVAAVQVGLASLPPDQRRAVQLRYLDGKTESETADEMNKSLGAVHGLVVRARASMRELLGRSSRWFYRK
jgi:RNA polymerase sigma-70 factor (ECF subfamily)